MQRRKLLSISIVSISILLGSAYTNAQDVKEDKKINWTTITNIWNSRHTQERASLGLKEYTYNKSLEKTAQTRAENLSKLNYSTHKRSSRDGYYNYTNIEKRFSGQNIQFETGKGARFSESIARGFYSCNKKDCTQDLISSIKKNYGFFMSEKRKRSQPHYNGIVMPQFTQIGLGVSRNPANKKFFLVTHYGVDVL